MSADTAKVATPAPVTVPVLDIYERRVLGVLVEKAKTTPDSYPMSINALVTGCNQKSNRDPVMSLDDEGVEATLQGLQKKGLVFRLTGSGRCWYTVAPPGASMRLTRVGAYSIPPLAMTAYADAS